MTNGKTKLRRHADGSTSVVMVGDSFANVITGLGMANVRAAGNTYVLPCSTEELETAYRTSTWFGKIIDIPAEDAVRAWRGYNGEKAQIQKIEAVEKSLGVQTKVMQALTWQRLYGGAAIILGGLPGRASEPIRPDSIRPGSLKFISVLTKNELTPSDDTQRNPMAPGYGLPSHFTINGTHETIHPSRMAIFNGRKASPLSNQQQFWGDPEWYHLEAAVKAADASGAVIDALLQEAKVDVLRVKGMTKGLATQEYEDLMIRRFQMVAVLKGMQNVMLLDGEDEWNQKQVTWTGLPDVAKHVLNILSGASDIPMFRLTGQNLTGLANTGDAETRAYYDRVAAKQSLELTPSLMPLDDAIIRSAIGGNPDDIWYEWNSLYQMSEKERAEIDKIEAETAATLAATGLVPDSALEKAVQNRMIESGRWPGLEQALEEAEAEEPGEEEDDPELVEMLRRALGAQAQEPNPPAAGVAEARDAAPRPLYIRRDVLNGAEIVAWAKRNGFTKALLADDLHVTILYCRDPVDWMALPPPWEGELTIPAGGPRIMERFGEGKDARVLTFKSSELEWRSKALAEAGAAHSHSPFKPHITLSYESGLDGEEASWPMGYPGEIKLGPEIWEPIDEEWKASIVEDQNGD